MQKIFRVGNTILVMESTKISTKFKINTVNRPNRTNSIGSFKFIDLFCGIGGFHQALSKIGGKCVFASDIDPNCRRVYEKNYKMKTSGDITEVKIESIPSFDVLCGGFPCQSFSKAGQRKGFDDKRGNLFFNICDIVAYHKPKYLLLENVKNLSSHDNGNTWKTIREHIDNLGYDTYMEPVVLNVLHFNVPQNRERVIIMCKRKDLGSMKSLPHIDKQPKLSLTNTLDTVINHNNNLSELDNKMQIVERVWNKFVKILVTNNIQVPKFPIWTDYWDVGKVSGEFQNQDIMKTYAETYAKYKNWIDKNVAFYLEHKDLLQDWLVQSRKLPEWFGAVRKFEWQAGESFRDDSMRNVIWTVRGSGIRVKRPDYISTLTPLVAMSMIPVLGKYGRKLTPRELLRCQSFPDTFKYEDKYIFKQVGNAVNVKMIEQCARFLLRGEKLF